MDLKLNGKTAIVTGGASGIGRQTCLDFAEEGVNVVIVDINEDGANEVAQEINEKGGTALVVKSDVTKRKKFKRLLKSVWIPLDV